MTESRRVLERTRERERESKDERGRGGRHWRKTPIGRWTEVGATKTES